MRSIGHSLGRAVSSVLLLFVASCGVDPSPSSSVELTTSALGGPSITTDSLTYAPGATITVTYAGLPGNALDWVAIAAAGSADTTFVAWVYTNGQISGTATFVAPAAGSYVARAFQNNGFTKLAESSAFTVASSTAISTDKSSYTSGATVTVTYAGLPGNATDWIAIAPSGSAATSYVAWMYTNGKTSGTATFVAPAAGSYVARSFTNNTYNLAAESAAFTVTSGTATATISTDKSSYAFGATVTVTYAGLPGNALDWIAIAAAGAANTSYVAWVYTNGQTSGTATFTAPAAGSYVARAFQNNGFTLLAESAVFTSASGSAGSPGLYVVAHPDDELLFINPDLENDILAGRPVRVVFVTSGDQSGPYLEREAAVLAAGAGMANVANTWSCTTATYAGKALNSCTLSGNPLVKYQFMRLDDSLVMNVFNGSTIGTSDNSSTYNQAQTLAVLTAIQAEVQPTRILTLDGTNGFGDVEHPDHIATGYFMLDVARSDGVNRQITMYRGYTMYSGVGSAYAPEPRNLSTAVHDEKLRIANIYNAAISSGQLIPPGDIYDEWCWRQYTIAATPGGPAPIHAGGGPCLQPTSTADGAALTTATCDGSAKQLWTSQANGLVVGLGGKCLGVDPNQITAVLKTCDGSDIQRWSLLSDGQLKGTRDTCLFFYPPDVVVGTCSSQASNDNPPVYSPGANQLWNF